MSNTTNTTAPRVVTIGDNSAGMSKSLLLSAGASLDVFGSHYREADQKLAISWQVASAIAFKLCEAGVTLPNEYAVDDEVAATGPATLTLETLKSPDGTAKKRNGAHNGLAYFIASHLGCELQTGRHITAFTVALARRDYTMADWNGVIPLLDNGEMGMPQLAELVPGMPNHLTPGAWRLHFRDVASKLPGIPCIVDSAELPIRLAKSRMAGSVKVYDEVMDVDRLCITGDRSYTFAYGASQDASGRRLYLENCRIGRDSLVRVAQAQIDTAADMARKEAEQAKVDKAIADAAAAKAKDEAEAKARGENVVSPLADDAGREAADKANDTADKPDTAEKPETVTDALKDAPPVTTPDTASKPDDTKPDANGTKPDAAKPDNGKVASDAETANNMRVNDERTRSDAEKQAEAWTPERVAEFVMKNFIASRMKDTPEYRREAVRMFTHLAGQFSLMGDAGKMLVAQPTNPDKAKDLIRQDVITTASKRATRK
jgi:hypothetical protein